MSIFAAAVTLALYLAMRSIQVWGAGSERRSYLALVRVLAALVILGAVVVIVGVVIDARVLLPFLRMLVEVFPVVPPQ
jgi:hypothetical protein